MHLQARILVLKHTSSINLTSARMEKLTYTLRFGCTKLIIFHGPSILNALQSNFEL